MTRKVSMWIVIALIGALAATTAAVIVLATHDDADRRAASARSPGDAWSHGWSDTHGDWQLPVMGDMCSAWDGGRDTPILPWVLFAIATGTAVGLLVAWSPWRTAPARAASGPPGGNEGITPATSIAVTEETAGQVETAIDHGADTPTTDAVAEAPQTEEVATAPNGEEIDEEPPEA